MAKRSAAFTKARRDLEDAVEAQNMFYGQHGRILQTADQLRSQVSTAETAYKDAAKAEAEKDPKFRRDATDLFDLELVSNRSVDEKKLQSVVKPSVFKKLQTVKTTVTVSSVDKAIEMGLIPEDKLEGLFVRKGFAAKLKTK